MFHPLKPFIILEPMLFTFYDCKLLLYGIMQTELVSSRSGSYSTAVN
jgi:hypothetical protein